MKNHLKNAFGFFILILSPQASLSADVDWHANDWKIGDRKVLTKHTDNGSFHFPSAIYENNKMIGLTAQKYCFKAEVAFKTPNYTLNNEKIELEIFQDGASQKEKFDNNKNNLKFVSKESCNLFGLSVNFKFNRITPARTASDNLEITNVVLFYRSENNNTFTKVSLPLSIFNANDRNKVDVKSNKIIFKTDGNIYLNLATALHLRDIARRCSAEKVIGADDFEGERLPSSIYEQCLDESSTGESSCEKTTNLRRSGSKSYKFVLHTDDPKLESFGGPRAELSHKYLVPFNKKYHYFTSFYLPNNGSFAKDSAEEIITQWHTNDNADKKHAELGNNTAFRSPTLSLQTQNGNFILDIRWDKDLKTENNNVSNGSSGGAIQKFNLGPYKLGRWYDFAYEVIWSNSKDSSNKFIGMVKVSMNGIPVFTHRGPNSYQYDISNNFLGPYLKFGIYKWMWANKTTDSTIRKIAFDDVYICEGE